jgi:tRNA threonylcarbamoyladenosine biosynthesis protein TsaE
VYTHTITIPDESSIPGAAQKVIALTLGRKVFALYGPMGAGKTTLVKEICRQLGSNDSFSSPTYSIVNEYLVTKHFDKIYHIDLYRLKNMEEALIIGIEDYLDGQRYCFIEWPEIIESLLPPDTVKIEMKVENNVRELTIFMQ